MNRITVNGHNLHFLIRPREASLFKLRAKYVHHCDMQCYRMGFLKNKIHF